LWNSQSKRDTRVLYVSADKMSVFAGYSCGFSVGFKAVFVISLLTMEK